MIDRETNVRLIEANSNPALTEDNSLLAALVPRMLDDAFKLTVDKLFGTRSGKVHAMEGMSVENGWREVGVLGDYQ